MPPFTWNGINFTATREISTDQWGSSTAGVSHNGVISLYGSCFPYGNLTASSSVQSTNLAQKNVNEIFIRGTFTVQVAGERRSIGTASFVASINSQTILTATANVHQENRNETKTYSDIHLWRRKGFSNQYFAQSVGYNPILVTLDNSQPWNISFQGSASKDTYAQPSYSLTVTGIEIIYGKGTCACDLNGDGKCTPEDVLCTYQAASSICPTMCSDCTAICCDVTGEGQCTSEDAECRLKESLGIHPNCFDN